VSERARAALGARGFSLIELLVVLAIVALLAAVAIPSYTSHVARGLRAEARAQLLMASQYMQRFHAANDSYAQDRAGTPVARIMPAQLMQSPAEGAAVYRLEIEAAARGAGAMEFRLLMRPVPGQRMADDACGAFTFDAWGRRGITGEAAQRDACWR
jgi:type IV pilus assembly protein PilE